MHGLCRRKIIWRISFLLTTIFTDQLVKFCATKDLLPAAGGFLEFICNQNIAWSVPLTGTAFVVFWMISFAALAYITIKLSFNIFLILALGGAVSNVIDRVRFGCVVDYISIGSFPVFNLADVFISCGIALFLIQEFFFKQKK